MKTCVGYKSRNRRGEIQNIVSAIHLLYRYSNRYESARSSGSEVKLELHIGIQDPITGFLVVRVNMSEPAHAAARDLLEIQTLGVQKGEIFLAKWVSKRDGRWEKCTNGFFSDASDGIRTVWFNSRVCDRRPSILCRRGG